MPSAVPVFERSTLRSEVTEHLQDLVFRGELPPGARLESEASFAAKFGLSRLTVREAITTLIGRGLLERRGNATYVARDYAGVFGRSALTRLILQQPLVGEVYEARRVVEREIAGLAALRATEEHLVKLQASIDAMKSMADAVAPDIVEADQQFHTVLSEAAGNRVLQEITHFLKELVVSINRRVTTVPDIVAVAISNHERQLQAVKSRDPDLARKLTEENLKVVEAMYMNHLEGQSKGT